MNPNPLSARRRDLVRLSAALAVRRAPLLRRVFVDILNENDPGEVEEVILQSYLFLGYPTALNAFGLWRDVSGVSPGTAGDPSWNLWERRGEAVCRTVYGGQYEGLRQNVRALHPDMEHWMVVEGYGKVLARPGLDLPTRELCIAGLLAVHGAPSQLYSHLRGALNAGAGVGEVEEALEVAFEFTSPDLENEARDVWDRVRARTVPDPPLRGRDPAPPEGDLTHVR